jgi:hypothetical protein
MDTSGNDKAFFLPDSIIHEDESMDKKTRTQLSIGLFIIGLAMILIQDLKRLPSIDFGFSWPFDILFYVGLIFMAIGYYLK